MESCEELTWKSRKQWKYIFSQYLKPIQNLLLFSPNVQVFQYSLSLPLAQENPERKQDTEMLVLQQFLEHSLDKFSFSFMPFPTTP